MKPRDPWPWTEINNMSFFLYALTKPRNVLSFACLFRVMNQDSSPHPMGVPLLMKVGTEGRGDGGRGWSALKGLRVVGITVIQCQMTKLKFQKNAKIQIPNFNSAQELSDSVWTLPAP